MSPSKKQDQVKKRVFQNDFKDVKEKNKLKVKAHFTEAGQSYIRNDADKEY